MARRDAARRDLFEPVREAEKSNPEKPVVSDERARGAAANQSGVNLYGADGKETETLQAIEGRGERQPDQQDGDAEREPDQQQAKQQEAKQQQVEQQEQQQIQELKSRDQEVKTHEQAHATVGGQYAGAPSYSYELGPDGKQYAVGGEVQIDIAPIPGDPQATIQKMQQVRAAALAPAQPSAADRSIAAESMQRQMQAQAELVQQNAAVSSKSAQATNQSADTTQQSNGYADTATAADLSYSVSDKAGSGAIVYPQRDTLAITAQMQLRRGVISNFYQQATQPQSRQSLQQV
ncbi:putative metalloprotease CJM1_0395 family protein [Rheinheimera maricola]|uniref:Catalase n=1 Tax=Rheinheimera maricola TaxID=2793282 RepID=A0ABS7XDS4_9GAMM|nr:putative metalloprotease CJM1_0395 family protein [Rheinheimera maricola]MBZ9613696.1 hypothetical protein [Rheinheimera maricola]